MARVKGPAMTPVQVREDDTPFRAAERHWKGKAVSPDMRRAFDVERIEWQLGEQGPDGSVRGVWTNEHDGQRVQVVRIPLDSSALLEAGLGQSKTCKGKQKASERDYAILVPAVPGLVLLPAILSEQLQRDLTRETLSHSRQPNNTSLSRHYKLPDEGLWQAWAAGKHDDPCERLTKGERVYRRERLDFEPVTMDNFRTLKGRGDGYAMHVEQYKPGTANSSDGEEQSSSLTVSDLIPKIRWTTIGYTYDWTSKAYDFDRPHVPLPPLVYSSCRQVVRAVPWPSVFESSDEGDWETWNDTYEPEAGVINFYQLKDMLTGHIDQSEIDAVRPLVSFSIGHSATFLIGGPTRDTAPLAILLRSGDGLLMSGKRGRRNFHGLPRVFAGTLPDYLSPDVDEPGWRIYGEYLARGSRININVREVFPRDKPVLS